MAGIGRPGIGIGEVSVTGISLAEICLAVELGIDNGNPVTIPVEEIDFDVLGVIGGEERQVAHGHHGAHRIPPGRSVLTIPVVVRNREVVAALPAIILQRSMDLRIRGNARIGLPIMSYTIPFKEERKIHF